MERQRERGHVRVEAVSGPAGDHRPFEAEGGGGELATRFQRAPLHREQVDVRPRVEAADAPRQDRAKETAAR